MPQPHTSRTLLIRTAVFAASVAILMSGRCKASCGEYVYSRYRMPADQHSSIRPPAPLRLHNVVQSELRLTPDIHGIAREKQGSTVPCSGPNCTKNPTPGLPIAPPSTTGSTCQDQLIHGRMFVDLESEVSLRRDLDSLARPQRGFPLLIEMPPEIAGRVLF